MNVLKIRTEHREVFSMYYEYASSSFLKFRKHGRVMYNHFQVCHAHSYTIPIVAYGTLFA